MVELPFVGVEVAARGVDADRFPAVVPDAAAAPEFVVLAVAGVGAGGVRKCRFDALALQGHLADALEDFRGGDAGDVEDGGRDVDDVDELFADAGLGDAGGPGADERGLHAAGVGPEFGVRGASEQGTGLRCSLW